MGFANIEDARASAQRSYQRHKEARKAKVRAYAAANPDKIRAISLARTADKRRDARVMERSRANARRGKFDAHVVLYRLQPKPPAPRCEPLHDAYVRVLRDSNALMYRWRYANDPEFALSERMRRQIKKKLAFDPHLPEAVRYGLKNDKRSNKVEALLNYTISDLRVHLERQFLPGMTWQGLSRTGWHVDHILPRKCFDVSTLDGIKAYWSLSNLRPLWARDNLRKGARIEALV